MGEVKILSEEALSHGWQVYRMDELQPHDHILYLVNDGLFNLWLSASLLTSIVPILVDSFDFFKSFRIIGKSFKFGKGSQVLPLSGMKKV